MSAPFLRSGAAVYATALLAAATTTALPASSAQVVNVRLAVPTPVEASADRLGAVAYATVSEKHASILLAQVVAVRPLAGAPAVSIARAARPLVEQDIPQAAGGRFAVLSTLYGPPQLSPLSLQVDNPPPPQRNGLGGPLERLLTRRMRVGELWLLAWNAATQKIDVNWPSGFSRLSGPTDVQLAFYALYRQWMDDPNAERADGRIVSFVLDRRAPANCRSFAFYAIGTRVQRRLLPTDPDPVQQHVVALLLQAPDTPETLRLDAFAHIRPDVRAEPAPGSDEAYLLRYAVQALDTSADQKWVDAAAQIARDANMMDGPPVDGKYSVYTYPELIAALQRRAAREAAENTPGMGRFATTELSSLEMHHRTSADDVRRDSQGRAAVVERHIPPG